jgi:hypothetical protein
MIMPMAARILLAIVGGLLVASTWTSIVGTVIVSRAVRGRFSFLIDSVTLGAYWLVTCRIRDYKRLDRILSTQAAGILLGQLFMWLGAVFGGFTLLLWPFSPTGLGQAFTDSGSSIFTLGFSEPVGKVPAILVFLAAFSGLVVITLQIAYLPTLYAAFNRRETEVQLLNARAGIPSWGPELLARTEYALGTGVSSVDTLPALYERWERWAADVAESHSSYLPLVRFRSPRALSSWVTALLAVLDSASLYLALSPSAAPEVPARLCLRGGFTCFTRIAQALGIDVPDEVPPGQEIALTYEEFLTAVERLREVNFAIERDPAAAWPDFVGWRANYERAAYAIADAVSAVPAPWSGPRRHRMEPIMPLRPAPGRSRATHTGAPANPTETPAGAGPGRRERPQPGALSTRMHSHSQPLSTICGQRPQDSLRVAAMSNSRVTFSLTRTPPASRGAFQLTPQSLRLMETEPSKPARTLPEWSLTAPVKVNGTVTGLLTPRMVRSPVRSKVSSLVSFTLVDLKVMTGYSSIARKSLLRRWPSRCSWPVSMLAALISMSTLDLAGSAPSIENVPSKSVNLPWTFVTIAWRALNPIRVCARSRTYVPVSCLRSCTVVAGVVISSSRSLLNDVSCTLNLHDVTFIPVPW